MAESQLLDAPSVDTQIDDFILSPQMGGSGGGHGVNDALEAKMSAVVYDRPHDEFVLPSGRTLFIYSKSEGQLRRIDSALQEWLDAERHGERKILKRWRFWRRRRSRVNSTLSDIQRAKYAFFCAVFEDDYNPEKHQEIKADEFLQMPIDLQTAIMAAHRNANDPTDLLGAILGRDFSGDDGKKKVTPRLGG